MLVMIAQNNVFVAFKLFFTRNLRIFTSRKMNSKRINIFSLRCTEIRRTQHIRHKSEKIAMRFRRKLVLYWHENPIGLLLFFIETERCGVVVRCARIIIKAQSSFSWSAPDTINDLHETATQSYENALCMKNYGFRLKNKRFLCWFDTSDRKLGQEY